MSESQLSEADKRVNEKWKSETTPAERVKAVIRHTYTPVDAATVAEEALTTTKTARKHLETLADDGFVATEHGRHAATLYQRSSESLIMERANQLLSELSTEELAGRISEMQAELRDYRQTYGVESPEALAVQSGSDALSDTTDTRLDESTVTEWQTTRRNLAFARAALSIGEASEFVGSDRSDPTPPVNS